MRRPWRNGEGGRLPAFGTWLAAVGVGLMLWPLGTWSYSQYAQWQLARQFRAPAPAAPDPLPAPQRKPEPPLETETGYGAEVPVLEPEEGLILWPHQAPPPGRTDFPEPIEVDRSHGTPPMRIEIPSIGLEAAAVFGVQPDDLRRGPGHYPETPLPGEMGNAAISGHRTTYGAWFRRLDELKEGDTIRVVYPDTTVTFAVEQVFVISPREWWVVRNTDYPAITLVTCHPAGSSAQRLVVRGFLIDISKNPPALPGATGGSS